LYPNNSIVLAMQKKISIFIVLVFLSPMLYGQIGGSNTYEFLNLPASARIAAQGGSLIAVPDADPIFSFHNPGLANSEMHNQLSINAVSYLAGINYGFFGYSRHLDSLQITFSSGFQYIYYGNFLRAEPTGEVTGSFDAGEYALNLVGAKRNGRFSYGANLKVIYSQLESYNSFGIALDLGGVYYDTANEISISGVIKNIGRQIKPYRKGNRESLPFDVQIGISKKLAHLPFRFSVTYNYLHKFDIRYENPNDAQSSSLFGADEETKKKKYILDKFFRHLIFGGEFFIGENFSVMLGYNHLRRKELSTDGKRGLTGFSFGAGVTIKKFRIYYGRATYHVAGASNHLSISTDLSRFFHRKNP